MPDITITLKFDSYSEAASFLQNGRDPTQKSPPMTIATSGAAERVVAMAASNRVEDGAATNATPAPDHEALRKDTHKAMVAYVGRGDGKSAKTARDLILKYSSGASAQLKECSPAQLIQLKAAFEANEITQAQ